MAINRHMFNLIFANIANPNIITLTVGIENVHRDVRMAHLRYQGSIGSVSHVDRPVLSRRVADQRTCPFERMHVVFEDCHHAVFVEIGHPMEKGVKVTSRVAVEGLANRINRHVVVDKFDLGLVLFKGTYKVLFLVAKLEEKLPIEVMEVT